MARLVSIVVVAAPTLGLPIVGAATGMKVTRHDGARSDLEVPERGLELVR
jgi:hypothetical protein